MIDTNNPAQDAPGDTYDRAPFQQGLEYMFHPYANIGMSNEILVNAEAQGFVIKAGNLDRFYKDYEQASPERDQEHIEKVQADCATAKKIYAELTNDYGIAIPKFMYVIGEARFGGSTPEVSRPGRSDYDDKKVRAEGEMEPILYTVMERIEGAGSLLNLGSKWSVGEGAAQPTPEVFRQFTSTMARYIADKYISKEPFYSDFGGGISMLEQFSFGHIEPDQEDKIYLHDVDPKVWKYDETMRAVENEELRQKQLNGMLNTLITEASYGQQISNATNEEQAETMSNVRQQVERIVTEYPDAAKFLERLPGN